MIDNLTTKEIASELNVSVFTIYRWIREGNIPYMRLIGRYRFNLEEVKKYFGIKQ